MYQNFNYYQPQPQAQKTITPQPAYLKGRPVSSLEEVRAIPVDFDGSIFFFPDLANKKIYTKQIQMDGTALISMYELKEIPLETSNSGYVTREEFDNAITQLRSLLESPMSSTEIPNQNPQFNF